MPRSPHRALLARFHFAAARLSTPHPDSVLPVEDDRQTDACHLKPISLLPRTASLRSEVSDMSIYDEYRIVINEAQRRVIMRALTNAMANDRLLSKDGALSHPTQDEYMQLIRLFSTIEPSVRKAAR